MTACAYCGKSGNLSKEHLFPAFLYEEEPGMNFGYNKHADEFITWDATVRDVCTKCNNGPLSHLDNYARHFLQANGYRRQFEFGNEVAIEYHYQQLSRWLLKTAYNVARYAGNTEDELRAARSYALGVADIPPPLDVLLEVLGTTRVAGRDGSGQPQSLSSQQIRSGRMAVVETDHEKQEDKVLFVRYVVVHSFVFHLVLGSHGEPRAARRRRRRQVEHVRIWARRISPNKNSVTIPVSENTPMEFYRWQALLHEDAWDRYEDGSAGS